jgi:tRNA-specific adenosine deaminase 1
MDGASADDIAACCLSQYSHLPAKSTKPGIRSDGKHEWTIVAGVVMEANGTCFCLSLCTGVKTLPYCAISPHGDLVHDSHAEVLARRGARTWLLKRLISEVKAQDGSESIDGMQRIFLLERDERWSIKADVKLHLYCSTFPCAYG